MPGLLCVYGLTVLPPRAIFEQWFELRTAV